MRAARRDVQMTNRNNVEVTNWWWRLALSITTAGTRLMIMINVTMLSTPMAIVPFGMIHVMVKDLGLFHVSFLRSRSLTRQMSSRLRLIGARRSPALLLERWLNTE